MANIRGPPPLEELTFLFRCSTCGEYLVTEKTARGFMTPKLNKELDEALKKGAQGAVLTFLTGCPKCKPVNPDAHIEVSALWPKLN